jgi:hypothetical protein
VTSSQGKTTLSEDYRRIHTQSRVILAYGITGWVQEKAKTHYIPDGAYDHWATLQETLAQNGDDCDGLEMLVFRFLQDEGFPEETLYHAILLQPNESDRHMVTLWFEDPEDPWVIDPTSAVVVGMKHISELPDGWVPIKIFNETEEFTVRILKRPKHMLERPDLRR